MSFNSDFNIINLVKRCLASAFSLVGLVGILLTAQVAQSQSVTPVFSVPKHSRGIAWAWDKVWVGGIAERGNWIWGYDPVSGALLDSFPAPMTDCLSLEGHQDGLAYLSPRSDTTYIITDNGVRRILSPFRHFAGLGSDGETLWGATYFQPQGMLFQMNTEGRILFSVPFGGTQTRDMAFLKDRLYVADQLTQNVRVIEPTTGRLIRNMPAPGLNPSGVASDGQGLWMLDEGDAKPLDQVYYIAIRPEGGIRMSALQHNYGSVVVDESREWNLWIYNDGPRTTRLVNFEAREGNDDIFIPHVWNFPQEIESGDSVALGISFVPAYQDSVRILFALTYDLDRVENIIDVRGKGVREQRNIVIPARNLSFGLCYYGQGSQNSNMRHLIIENAGGEPLTVREIRFNDDSFFTGGIELPHTFIQPGAFRIPIFFRPSANHEVRATGTIVSDDPDSPQINFSLSGQGQLNSYPGGEPLWNVQLGDDENENSLISAIQPLDDVTGDGLADVIIASNDYTVASYHAASTLLATPYWSYNTNTNPWRSGLVPGPNAICEGSDWDRDGRKDIVFGLGDGAMTVVALSGNTGEEMWIVDTHNLPGNGGVPRVVQAGYDLTGDNFNDVIVATSPRDDNYTTQSIFMINGMTSRVVWFAELSAIPIDIACLDDITGDGISDIVTVLTDGTVIGLDGRGGNQIYDNRIGGDVRDVVACADINRDHSMDLCIATYNNGIYMLNGSNGSPIWHRDNLDGVTLLTAMGDLNDNGSSDLVFGTIHSFFSGIDGLNGDDIWYEPYQVGARPLGMARINDLNNDDMADYLVGTYDGRLFCLSGNGRGTLWSYSNVGEGHGINHLVASRDIDGNGQMDIFAAMENGTVYAFAGSFVGHNSISDDHSIIPGVVTLAPAYPNPFNSTVSVPFTMLTADEVSMRIFDVNGREVFASAAENLKAGNHRDVWNGSNSAGQPVGSGNYFLRLESNSGHVVRQIQLVR